MLVRSVRRDHDARFKSIVPMTPGLLPPDLLRQARPATRPGANRVAGLARQARQSAHAPNCESVIRHR
jgi:hypothetical protein